MAFKPPKQWVLTESETISTFCNWQSNLLYHLSLNNEFAAFIADTFTWQRKSVANRGLTDDVGEPAADRKTAAQKNIQLERMLGIIAQFCPALLRNEILKKSTSLKWIWQRVRKHYSFSQSEVNFLKISDIKREQDERYETLYQRIIAHLEDNLLTRDSGLQHDGAAVTQDEEMSPTVERLAVYLWLNLIDSRLPSHIARVYAHDLQTKSLKDIQPQICDAMSSLLADMNAQDEVSVNYTRSTLGNRRRFNNNNYNYNNNNNNNNNDNNNNNNNNNSNGNRSANGNNGPSGNRNFHSNSNSRPQGAPQQRQRPKQCVLCRSAGRAFQGHDISTCWFISKFDKMDIIDAFQVNVVDEEGDECEDTRNLDHTSHDASCCQAVTTEAQPSADDVRRVSTDVSPFFYAFYQHHIVKILIDSGATSSLISDAFARRVSLDVHRTLHGAKQLDKSPLPVSGEVKFSVSFGDMNLKVDGLVNDQIDYDILAGVPFCKANNIDVLLSREMISIHGKLIPYGSRPESIQHSVYRAESIILRNDREKVLYPGDYLEIHSDELAPYEDEEISIEPRVDSPMQGRWPSPTISRVIQGSVRIANNSEEPVRIGKCQHFAQIRRVTTSDVLASSSSYVPNPSTTAEPCSKTPPVPHSSTIKLDPDGLMPPDLRKKFQDTHAKWDNVFNPRFGRYNGASGPFVGNIKFGNMEPPSTKPKIPFYNQSNLRLLQEKADMLEELGVLVAPEVAGVDVKFASPSFLRQKPNGDHRFVTSFTELGQYLRTLPVATTSSDKIIRELAKWKYVIKTDLTQSFFQIPISKQSMPYLATVTPYKGLRVYTTIVMGMPGSSEILQELMCRIFGNEMTEGWILIIADDMYVCSNSVGDILERWDSVLETMNRNGLTLSAVKTFVCPKSFDALGWRWTSGTLTVTAHKVTPLLSADPPKTCSNMRSFIGAFKALSRCIPRYSSLASPLEAAIKGLTGSQHVTWTDELREHFRLCKESLKSPAVLTVPVPDDKLILTVDASPVNAGLGATLYVCRGNKRLTAECFSLKLKTHHLNWEPCELEALAIASAIQHFSPYVRDSKHPLEVLTDSKPCVQAFAKLRRGHFSASARVSTFLSTLSQHSIVMSHLKGTNNTSSDYASRNPLSCVDSSCQICTFVKELSESVVHQITVEDVMSGATRMPFLNRAAWKSAQHSSTSLRRVFAHLTQGTRPSRKAKHVRDVKRYLAHCSIDNQGLIIVRKSDPFVHHRELIVVPDEILPGLLTALHMQFNHATKHQLTKLFDRHFYAISSAKNIEDVVNACQQCNSLKQLNKELFHQTSSPSPTKPGEQFASDVIQRTRQCILVTRDIHTSFTTAVVIPDQKADTLRSALLETTSFIRLPSCTVRIDNAPGFLPLKADSVLLSHGIQLDLGRVKNINKNPVAEKSNQELQRELLRIDPSGAAVTQSNLRQALKNLNTRIRNRGLSSQEMLFCRDHCTGTQLSFQDGLLSRQQESFREQNHTHSSRSKANGALPAQAAAVTVGDLVFIKAEGNKNKSRDMYLIVGIVDSMASLQKLNGSKFLTKRYEVPLVDIFPAVLPSSVPTPTAPLSSSSEEDEEDPPPSTGGVDSDSSDEAELPSVEGSTHPHPRRSHRTRNPPAWLRSEDWDRS